MAGIDVRSDGELLAAVGDNDGAAFAVFYRRHLAAVVAFLMRETGDREAAADLAAEVFAAVLLSADRCRARGSALPWVMGIARNKLRMSRRRGRIEDRARLRLGVTPVELEDDDLDLVERLADEGARGVSALVDQLPEHERDAVHSRIVLERSYAEIAAQLRCSELVVRQRVSRGLARVRKELERP